MVPEEGGREVISHYYGRGIVEFTHLPSAAR